LCRLFSCSMTRGFTLRRRQAKRSRRLRRVANARERPDVTVLVDEYEDDWGRLWWVTLRGRARVLETGEEVERALRLLVDKYEQYRRERPGRPVLAVDILEWRSWDGSATALRSPADGLPTGDGGRTRRSRPHVPRTSSAMIASTEHSGSGASRSIHRLLSRYAATWLTVNYRRPGTIVRGDSRCNGSAAARRAFTVG
jgi:hypothetical protein